MKNSKNKELAVCGFATVKKLEKNHPEKITRLYLTQDKAPLFGGLCKKLAKNHGIYNVKPASDLEKLCGTVHHQGVVAMIQSPEIQEINNSIIDSFIKTNEHAVLLDRIGNANNFGAIIRSAVFFGIKNIIIPIDQAQTSITTSSYRIAEGGMEYVNIYSTTSCVRLLEDLKNKMIRIGTDLKATKTIDQIQKINTQKKPYLIVLGNEENGISPEVKNNCDILTIIPWANMQNGQKESQVESLNVAQAASIIFYELCR